MIPQYCVTARLSQVAKGFIAAAIFLTYPLAGFVIIDIIMNHFWNKNGDLPNAALKESILRACTVVLICITAIIAPNLGPLLSLVGALTISLLNLVFPALIEICLYYPPEYNYGKLKWVLVKDIFYVIVGILILVQGTVFSIKDMISEWGGGDTTTGGPETTAEETTANMSATLTTALTAAPPDARFRFL